MKHLAKNLVILVCLVALGAFGTWIALRPRLLRGDGFTDGEQFLAATQARAELRLARWDEPRPFGGAFSEAGGASEPCLDPTTGRIYFVKGDSGREELWVATPEGDGYAVRPISELNSPRRETAPCFVDGWLWFASDREGGMGGLDLWRAPLMGGAAGERFLAPENLGAPINSTADDTDPALRSGGDGAVRGIELWFASRREAFGGGDFDLFSCRFDGARGSPPERCLATRSPYDERAPAFAPDGRLLCFASNRPDGHGGFDLWRCLASKDAKRGGFEPPVNLGSPNSAGDESGPTLGDDGFTLLFASNRAPDANHLETGESSPFGLFQTRTRELFPIESPAFTLTDFTILLVLALVALLAFLARRWEALDVLYKCLVVSLLVHLLFLWYSQRVEVEAKALETPIGGDSFEVQLLGDLLADVAKLEDRAVGESVGTTATTPTVTAAAAQWASVAAPTPAESAPSERATAIPRDSSADSTEQATRAVAPVALGRAIERNASSESSTATASSDPVRAAPAVEFERLGGTAPEVTVAAKSGPAPAPIVIESARRSASFQPAGESADDAGLATKESRAGAPHAARAESPSVAAETPQRRAANGTAGGAVNGVGGELERTSSGPSDSALLVATRAPSDRAAPAGDESPLSTGGRELTLAPAATNGDASRLDGGDGPTRAAAALAGVFSKSGDGAGVPEVGPTSEMPLAGGGKPVGDPDASASAPARANGDPGDDALAPSGTLDPGKSTPLALHGPADRAATDEGTPAPTGAARSPGLALAPLLLSPSALSPGSISPNAAKPGESSASPQPAGPARAKFGGNVAAAEIEPKADRGRLELPAIAAAERAAPADLPTGPSAPRLYERRFGEAKQVALKEGGGSTETERAVLAGLRYLAQVQRQKGFFGDNDDFDQQKYGDVRIGKTGLAVLAFLGAGHTPKSGSEFSGNVASALAWLAAKQDPASGHFGNGEAYSHGIATYAFAECYAITHDEALRPPLERAVAHLLAMQLRGTNDARKEGGWPYYNGAGAIVDDFPRTSISAWQVMALESAKVGGLDVPDAALAAAKKFFLQSFDPDFGGFRYTRSPNWNGGYDSLPASTPAAMFALTLLGAKDDEHVTTAQEYVLERLPNGYRSRGEDAFVRRASGNLYFWYYGTLSLFCRGGEPWRQWNEALKQTLLPAQKRDGSWDVIDVYAQRYAGDDGNEKAYTTSMCVLMLEVYYRYFTPLLGKFGASEAGPR